MKEAVMNMMPIAQDDVFTVATGASTASFTGNLGNGAIADSDPDGTILGFAGVNFGPFGDDQEYLSAYFDNGVLTFVSLQQSGYVTFPVVSTSVLIRTEMGGYVVLKTNGDFTYTPPVGYVGPDSFAYTLVDSNFATDVGHVTLTVESVIAPDSPVAAPVDETIVTDALIVADPPAATESQIVADIQVAADPAIGAGAPAVIEEPAAAETTSVQPAEAQAAAAENMLPVAVDDYFYADQGSISTVISGDLGADNSLTSDAVDSDPDGGALGFAAAPFGPFGDGEAFLSAFFTDGVLNFLSIQNSGYVSFPAVSTSQIIMTAQGGRVVLSTTGDFVYTSPAGFSGVDYFNYALVDEALGSVVARVTINVDAAAGANNQPIAVDDTFGGMEDLVITGNVLENNGNGADSDPEGNALAVNNHTIPTTNGGWVSLYINGSFVYQPPASFSGIDSFSYTVTDGQGASSIGTVTLNIAADNDAPIAIDDFFSAMHGAPISGNVLVDNGNGVDTDVENNPLIVVAGTITTAAGGEVTLEINGDFTYAPPAGFVGTDSFDYRVDDGHGGSAWATVTLEATNTGPVARNDWFSAAYGAKVSGNLLLDNGGGADSDADGDSLNVATGIITTAQGGTVELQSNGTFTYQSKTAFYGTDSFQYAVDDGFGGTATGVAFITTAAPPSAIMGTSSNNIITGTSADDRIFALGGDDTVSGGVGNDFIDGGDRRDLLQGDAGNDELYGQAGRDTLRGGDGDDYLSGGSDADDLNGGAGNDMLFGGGGADKLTGGLGSDMFIFDFAFGANADRIQDFTHQDKLAIVGEQYGLAAGSLEADHFALAGAGNVAHGRFIYDGSNRSLSWDADGNAATANSLIAVFSNAQSLSDADFVVI
jgi:Ca2+-binding RTX toxin-like protein